MILRVFIEFFGVKIVIGLSNNHYDLIITVGFYLSQNSRYILDISDILPIYLRYFTNISMIFTDIFLILIDIFPEIPTHACVRYTLDILPKYRKISDISPKYRRFY